MYVNGHYTSTSVQPRYIRQKMRDAEAQARCPKVKVGDVVRRPWESYKFDTESKIKTKYAKVIYVHPQGYYHVVQFKTKSGVYVNEAFSGTKL